MKQQLIATSQLLNAWLFFGFADETVSAHCWRSRHKPPFSVLRPVIDGLFYCLTLGKSRDHCFRSYESEMRRNHFPMELR